jgi:hypothetical protein
MHFFKKQSSKVQNKLNWSLQLIATLERIPIKYFKRSEQLDLAECLVEPIRQKYKDSNNSTDIYELWTVLEERE